MERELSSMFTPDTQRVIKNSPEFREAIERMAQAVTACRNEGGPDQGGNELDLRDLAQPRNRGPVLDTTQIEALGKISKLIETAKFDSITEQLKTALEKF